MEQRRKIAFIVPGLFIAGGIRVALALANALGEHFDSKVVSPEPGNPWPQYKVPIVSPKMPPILGSLLNFGKRVSGRKGKAGLPTLDFVIQRLTGFRLDEQRALLGLLKDFDVAIATWFPTAFIALQSDAKPMILLQDFPELVAETMGNVGLRLFKAVLRAPLGFLSISSYITEIIKSENPSAKIYYIGNGVDLDTFYPRKVTRGDEPLVSVILRRPRFKGSDIAVESLNLAAMRTTFKAIVISEFPEDEFRLKFRPRFPYVFYQSGVSDEELARIYSSSDVFLFTSRAEGFGLPPLEAMACGTAVVSTNAKGNMDYMVNGYNALVAKTFDPGEIADLLVQALDNRELRQSLAQGGLETARRWDFRLVVDRTRRAIEEELQRQGD
ncbi:Predicted glycosyltransferase [Acidilobus saccharovorans 345-15]|uniref:Predicted glycosyltransferase n=1 Tax=Acidilobus saccharovorans (strain DSM 16705 / JCM 18335 / VKM B-2471 / 345-15) TaxID=666510 RepID=D9Q184_ACIS3|nr:Predicted glycosyltransferase [Acidilobus saccharovorans 345-15]